MGTYIRHTMGQDWGGRRRINPIDAPKVSKQDVYTFAEKHGINVQRAITTGSGLYPSNQGPWWRFDRIKEEWLTCGNTNYECIHHLEGKIAQMDAGVITVPELIYKENYIVTPDAIYSALLNDVEWLSEQARRKEAFMARETTNYKYEENRADAPVYTSTPYHNLVLVIQDVINNNFNCDMDLCFLNYYEDQKQALGWHSDDSPVIDHSQPIVVVSFGEVRQLWIRPIGFKGEIPKEWKFTLGDGSVFFMPAGFQQAFQHKIPKGDRDMGGRISLTFRSKKKT